MKRLLLLPLLAVGGLILSQPASAQSVVTDPVGFTTNSLVGNSDTFQSLPFIRPPAFVGGIASASGTTITVSGAPWLASQFVYAAGTQPNHYYALIGPPSSGNAKEGHTYAITSNTANTLTVALGTDNLTGIPANAQLSVIPNWTLATVFPATDQGVSFTATTSSPTYKTQIRVPNTAAAGINLPNVDYFFINNGSNVGWRLVGNDTTDHGDDALLPDSYFVVRNSNSAPTLPLVTLGGVLYKKLTVPLLTNASTQQDNPVSIVRPLNIALDATGLNIADGSFTTSDQLLVFNNATVGFDKAPSAIYVQNGSATNGPWRLSTDPNTDRGSDVVPSGTGFIIRKGAVAGAPTAFWTNNFPVQAVTAVSRKTHTGVGDFDINLPLNVTAGVLPGIECRNAGGTPAGAGVDYQVVMTFPVNVSFSGQAVTSGAAAVNSTTGNGTSIVTVNLSGVSNAQRVTVTLLNVNDGTFTNDVAVQMGVLIGDTTANGAVNSSDIGQTKGASGQTTGSGNFRLDVTVSGSINSSDIGAVKARSGTSLP